MAATDAAAATAAAAGEQVGDAPLINANTVGGKFDGNGIRLSAVLEHGLSGACCHAGERWEAGIGIRARKPTRYASRVAIILGAITTPVAVSR